MAQTPRILVGTLYSGEGDYPRCLEMLRRQTIPFEHLVIQDLPEVEAHVRLYRAFEASGADFLVKIDADMVLVSDDAIERMLHPFAGSELEYCSYHVHDFFTDTAIYGVNCISSKVRFDWDRFVESDRTPDRHLSCLDPKVCGRVCRWFEEVTALHAHFPHELQAFRFGYNRQIKKQRNNVAAMVRHFEREPLNPMLRMACLGVIAAGNDGDPMSRSYGEHLHVEMARMKNRDIDAAATLSLAAATLGMCVAPS